ncbi:uncharacterized protein si:cabz01074946.1 isoform X2 [Dunckerocampus dactyliophorus]|uniref:uncharacterized protein si:cabz01074946.1 isoform X2 n=1 Tax=Dunckerocampus dactyliophorus TaxID=161453 RepID=UPI0024060F30|nr:uncharacterized protein si:cabz01074946.1 isoform X2 [Dunckerocampus dactyliophorus]
MTLLVVLFRERTQATVLLLLWEAAAGIATAGLQQVAYQGEAVTLSSSGDPSWKLVSIKWSVYFNETWIATFHGGKSNTERFFLFRGRLSLNTTTGDLTIHNVTREDAMDYSVELVDVYKRSMATEVTLVVRKHLQKPTLRTLFAIRLDDGCWVGLNCSSQDVGVNLSWTLEPPLGNSYNTLEPVSKSGVLLAFFHFYDVVQFTCTSSSHLENISNSLYRNCNANTGVMTTEHRPRDRSGLFVLAGIVVGLLASIMLNQLRGESQHVSR